jgi:hypothetical protein
LNYDHILAKTVFVSGVVIMLLSLLWSGLLLVNWIKPFIVTVEHNQP